MSVVKVDHSVLNANISDHLTEYRYGGTIKAAYRTLKADGGFPRYYAGLGAALFQGPLSRFGDTAVRALRFSSSIYIHIQVTDICSFFFTRPTPVSSPSLSRSTSLC